MPQAPNDNWLSKLLAMFGMGLDPDFEKNRQLREIKKSLKKSFKKYIRVSQNLIEPGLAKVFYDIYVAVAPAQVLLANVAQSGALRSIFVEAALNARQTEILSQLDESALKQTAGARALKEVTDRTKELLVELISSFDLETTKRIDRLYNLMLWFSDFLQFNIFFLLKKFDSGLPERDFKYLPHFEPLGGDYLIEDLRDFCEILKDYNPAAEWETMFDVLKLYKNLDVVDRAAWRKVANALTNLKRSNVLPLIVMHLTKDPGFRTVTQPKNEKIVEPYLEKLKTQTEVILQKIQQERKTEKINSLTQEVFGTNVVLRLKNYTEKANLGFSKKLLGGYLYIEPLNYLKAFLLDYFKRDIRELVNLLLVKGHWVTNGLSQPLSDSFYALMELSDRLTVFDDALAEETERGGKIKSLTMRSERDQNALSSLKQILKDVNGQAKVFLVESSNHLITIGKHLKAAIEDLARPNHDLLNNWKALETATDKPLKDWMTETYKKVYFFLQLIQFYIKE